MLKVYKYKFNFHITGFYGVKQGDISVDCFDEKKAENKACDLLTQQKILLPYENLKLSLIEQKEVAIL